VGALSVAAVTAGCASSSAATVAVGKPVPEIAAKAISGGGVSLSSYRGRWVVVNFFATWCDPCKKEYPELVRFAAQQGTSAQVVGVVFEDPGGNPLKFHRDEGGTWPIVADPSGAIAIHYEVSALPQSFVVNPEGKLVARIFGGVTATKLEAMVAGRPVRQ
jgi:cytochrome c biogenesis protein CcmG/thiol:disulfide interchange protein DsbE